MTTRRPIAFAHRGASGHAHENTIEAFRLALAQGATGLESDTWLARDGVPILIHDPTSRHRGRRIYVRRRTARDLAALDIPTLAELYAACGTGFELSLDLQHPEVGFPVLEVAEAASATDRLWACHDDLEFLLGLRRRSREVHIVCSTRPRRMGETVTERIRRLADLGIEVLNMKWPDWTSERVETAHAAGLLAFGWDAQDDDAMERLLTMGIDGLYSDFPDRLVAAIERASRRPSL